jgi:hypothetical protein
MDGPVLRPAASGVHAKLKSLVRVSPFWIFPAWRQRCLSGGEDGSLWKNATRRIKGWRLGVYYSRSRQPKWKFQSEMCEGFDVPGVLLGQ